MLDLGFLFLLTLWSIGVGLRLRRLFDIKADHPFDAFALAIPLGLGTLSLGTFALAEFGRLDRPALLFFMTIAAFVAMSDHRLSLRENAIEGRRIVEECFAKNRRFGIHSFFDVCFLATLLGTLLTALAPTTDGDALCYHLQVPKLFLEHHSAMFDPDLHETVYPLATEMLYAVALAFRGPVACRLAQWLLGVAFALNVSAIARPFLAEKARFAGTIALLVPAISNGMGAPLNDVALATFGNAALFAFTLWFDRPTIRRALLVGVLCGCALGVKYPALVWGAILGSSMLCCVILNRSAKQKPFHVVAFAVAAILIGGCWYLRAYHFTGNPVHPFFRSVFGGAGLDEVLDPIKRPLKPTVWNLASALGPLTLRPDRFDSLSHQLGPAFLLFLPAFLIARPPRKLVGIVALGFAFITICMTVRQSTRFLLIAVGPLSVGVGWIACILQDRQSRPAKALIAILAGILVFEAAIAVGRARHGIGVVLGRESTESYLSRREPTYQVGRWIETHLPKSARLIGQDHRGFYIPRPYAMELAHRRRTGLGTRGESSDIIAMRLREDGFTHVLFCPPEPIDAVEFDPTLSRRLDGWCRSRQPLFDAVLADGDGVARRYRIFDLAETDERRAER